MPGLDAAMTGAALTPARHAAHCSSHCCSAEPGRKREEEAIGLQPFLYHHPSHSSTSFTTIKANL